MQSTSTSTAPFEITWCHDRLLARQIVDLFLGQISPHYISHSELQTNRAVTPSEWRADFHSQLLAEVQAVLELPATGASQLIATANDGNVLAGVAFVSLDEVKVASRSFASLDDLVVGQASQGQGLGRALFDWVCAELRAMSIERLFLESGIGNLGAHRFFERRGCRPVSVTMIKELGA